MTHIATGRQNWVMGINLCCKAGSPPPAIWAGGAGLGGRRLALTLGCPSGVSQLHEARPSPTCSVLLRQRAPPFPQSLPLSVSAQTLPLQRRLPDHLGKAACPPPSLRALKALGHFFLGLLSHRLERGAGTGSALIP